MLDMLIHVDDINSFVLGAADVVFGVNLNLCRCIKYWSRQLEFCEIKKWLVTFVIYLFFCGKSKYALELT